MTPVEKSEAAADLCNTADHLWRNLTDDGGPTWPPLSEDDLQLVRRIHELSSKILDYAPGKEA